MFPFSFSLFDTLSGLGRHLNQLHEVLSIGYNVLLLPCDRLLSHNSPLFQRQTQPSLAHLSFFFAFIPRSLNFTTKYIGIPNEPRLTLSERTLLAKRLHLVLQSSNPFSFANSCSVVFLRQIVFVVFGSVSCAVVKGYIDRVALPF